MQKYLSGQSIDLTVPLVDAQGDPAQVNKMLWTLFSEKLEVLETGSRELSDVLSESVVITLPETSCTILNGLVSEVRQITVTLEIGDKKVITDDYFMLEKSQTIIPAVNSFVTYLESLRLMPDFPKFIAINTVGISERKSALIAAYRNIGNVNFNPSALVDEDDNQLFMEDGTEIWTTRQFTPVLYAKLKESIKRDFESAQMEEAEYLLGGDGTEDLRSKGVLSYTSGEVKQFYRTQKPLDMCVSKHGLRYIGKYISYNKSVTRV